MSKIELNWITGKRLLERWNIDIRELDICIKSGLPVYNPNLELEEWGPFRSPIDESDEYNEITDEIIWHESGHTIFRKNNLYDFQVLLNSSTPFEDTGLTKDRILDNLLFKLEDVERFEKKHSKKREIESRPRKPISTDQPPQIKSQSATGSVTPQIEVPWMNGKMGYES